MEIPSKAHAELDLACMLGNGVVWPGPHDFVRPLLPVSQRGGFTIGVVEIDLTNGVIVDSTLFCENPK